MSKEFFGVETNTETSVFHSNLASMDVPALSSAALARLVEEVRHDDPIVGKAYDRTHNRHNR